MMKTYFPQTLLEDLQTDVEHVVAIVKDNFETLNDKFLLQQPAPGKWSIAQVIEHLNSYNNYYLPEIKKAFTKYHANPAAPVFKPGWLGNYFTKLMKPSANGKIASKMQSPKDHRPITDLDASKVIQEFLNQEELLLQYLEQAKKFDINKRCIPISISKFIHLKMGDTFRFLIAHQQRHMLQALRGLEAVANVKDALIQK